MHPDLTSDHQDRKVEFLVEIVTNKVRNLSRGTRVQTLQDGRGETSPEKALG